MRFVTLINKQGSRIKIQPDKVVWMVEYTTDVPSGGVPYTVLFLGDGVQI
jgi:hypothetical protein